MTGTRMTGATMRRRLTVGAAGVVAALALTGCGVPTGTDGDLVDDWPALAAPTLFQPAAGTCHPRRLSVGYLTSYGPVPCEQWHEAETVHVGTLPADQTGRSTLPPVGSPARVAAYTECEQAANRMLGADWRSGRVWLDVVFPSTYGWRGGARWFRCDVGEVQAFNDRGTKPRAGSVRGALTGAAPLAHRCFDAITSDGTYTGTTPVSCTARHDAEFVGVYQDTSASYTAMRAGEKRIVRRCYALIAAYAKVPDDGDLEYRTGWIYQTPGEEAWRNGNRGVQCLLWVTPHDLTRSVKGGGSRALPIR